jgi:hypothetical protein
MVELVVAFFHWVFDTYVLQDNVSDIVKEGGVQRLFDGELIVQVVLWCLPACVYKKIVSDPFSFWFGFLGSGALCIYFLKAMLFLGLWCMCATKKIGLFLKVIQLVDCLALLWYILEWQKKLVNI